jgi:hypothetical protein
MKYRVMWIKPRNEEFYDRLWEAKACVSSSFAKNVMFTEFGRYIVAEYYFEPVALIVKGE